MAEYDDTDEVAAMANPRTGGIYDKGLAIVGSTVDSLIDDAKIKIASKNQKLEKKNSQLEKAAGKISQVAGWFGF